MHSLRQLFKSHLFYAFMMIFITAIFILNLSFFVFANIHYTREIDRQYDNLKVMIAHLSRETDQELIPLYLEHYTHNTEVILTFIDQNSITVYTNDQQSQLSSFDEIYDDQVYVGKLSVSFASSAVGKDYAMGFVLLNLSSIIIFFLGMLRIRRYLWQQLTFLQSDLSGLNRMDYLPHYEDMAEIKQTLEQATVDQERSKDIYLSHIRRLAHEVKTPVTASKIYLQGMIQGRLPKDQATLKEIQHELDRIEEILPKFIEMDQHRLAYDQDITQAIERYIKRYHHVFDAKEIRIDVRLEPLHVLISDADLLFLIEHLLLNSFYYSNNRTSVTIQTIEKERILKVIDHGIGMTKETMDRIHEGRYRAPEAIKRHQKGSGMGYQIIFEILKNIHATMDIQSELGQGTTVTINFSIA